MWTAPRAAAGWAAAVALCAPVAARGADCAAPIVTLKVGRDGNCSDLGTHGMPLYDDPSACHGWVTEDPTYHDSRDVWLVENSANNIRCLADGGLELTLFPTRMDCTGPSVVRRFYQDQCEREGAAFVAASSLACCNGRANCAVGAPFSRVAWGQTFLNGEQCDSDGAATMPPQLETEPPTEPLVPGLPPPPIANEPAEELTEEPKESPPVIINVTVEEPQEPEVPPPVLIIEEPPLVTIEPWLTKLPTSTELPTIIATMPTRPPTNITATLPTAPPSLRLTAPPSILATFVVEDSAMEAAERARQEQAGAHAAVVAGVAVANALAVLAALVLFGFCLYKKLRSADLPDGTSSSTIACKQDLEAHAVHPSTELVKV
jgi:hypothetical protein